jgi:DMSO/TMAO reductase YedYZ molybdopterin-dependent catalytic subunit
MASAGAALLFQGLLHLAVPAAPFAPFSVGELAVRYTPGSLATWAIDLLGHQALRLVGLLTILGALALGGVLGRLAPWALALIALLLSLGADVLDPTHPDLLLTLIAAGVAGAATWLTSTLLHDWQRSSRHPFHAGRRQVLISIAWGLGALALGGGAAWRWLSPQPEEGAISADLPLQVASDARFDTIPGLSPLVTAPQAHYEVEIDLEVPLVSAEGWRLLLHGAVRQPLTLTLEDLRGLFSVEHLVTMSCISNPVGGPLVGNARWIGIPLADLLEQAAPVPTARTLQAQGADGYYDAIPLEVARQPDVLVAFGMDGQWLPPEHGFPARLLLPGRYGFKSVKWLQDLTVLTTTPLGYWEQRGWDAQGIIRTESRFDVPADHSQVRSPFTTAGIAWAGMRGVRRVEVSSDDGRSWQVADLEPAVDTLSWRRWRLTLALPPGVYPLSVRATDGTGRVQGAISRPPHPSGASGYHRIVVSVAEGSSVSSE